MMGTIGTSYLRKLTDDFGIWQHTHGNEIDRSRGYSLDDSARGLLAALAYQEVDLARIYVKFIEEAFNQSGPPANFFGPDRKALDTPPSDDAIGEVYWSLSYALNCGFESIRVKALIEKVKPFVMPFSFLRSRSYALLGAVREDMRQASHLATALTGAYSRAKSKDWQWFEDQLTYANAIMPYALFAYYESSEDDGILACACDSLDFLNVACKQDGVPIAIGNNGWYPKDGIKALYAQQPIDPAYQILANNLAWKLTKKDRYRQEAEKYLSWFWGNNVVGKPLIDQTDQSCRDGIDELGISENKGSENIVCYLLAQAASQGTFLY